MENIKPVYKRILLKLSGEALALKETYEENGKTKEEVKEIFDAAKLDEIAKFSNYIISPMLLGDDGSLSHEPVKAPAPIKKRFR